MPISSVVSNSLSGVADKMYYSIFVNSKTIISLQRCSVTGDDWLNDPNENSRKSFIAPDSFKSLTDRLFDLMNAVFSITFTKLVVKSSIQNKRLVVSVTGTAPTCKQIKNLETWLGENLDYVVEAGALWNDMNSSIEAINNEKNYI